MEAHHFHVGDRSMHLSGAVVEIGGYICDASARQVQNSETELVQLPGCIEVIELTHVCKSLF